MDDNVLKNISDSMSDGPVLAAHSCLKLAETPEEGKRIFVSVFLADSLLEVLSRWFSDDGYLYQLTPPWGKSCLKIFFEAKTLDEAKVKAEEYAIACFEEATKPVQLSVFLESD